MPQTSDEMRELMNEWFGDPIDMGGPYMFLRRHGYTEKAGMFYKPTPSHTVSEFEWKCLCFLFEEWDFGFDEKGATVDV
jgi:hypothetical protein